jgi:hypothetical protein
MYFNGTFQEENNRSNSFDAQFQIRIELNHTDNRLYYYGEHRNETIPNYYPFNVSIRNSGPKSTISSLILMTEC